MVESANLIDSGNFEGDHKKEDCYEYWDKTKVPFRQDLNEFSLERKEKFVLNFITKTKKASFRFQTNIPI